MGVIGSGFSVIGNMGAGGGIMSGAGDGAGFRVEADPVVLKAKVTMDGSMLNWANVSLTGALNRDEKCPIIAACA